MENLYSNLHNLYSVQKTLRFELKPQGRTEEYLIRDGIIDKDIHKAEAYKRVKKYFDEYHKIFIDKSLKNIKLNDLDKYYELFLKINKTKEEEKEFNLIKANMRKQIAKKFKETEGFGSLFSKDMILDNLTELYKNDLQKTNDIGEFKSFATYFTGFNENRKNMYSDEEKSTAIAYRLVNENLVTFINNIIVYDKLRKNVPNISEILLKGLGEVLDIEDLDEVFNIEYYNNVLTEKGIEKYNLLISGNSTEEGKNKGLNEYINEYKNAGMKLPKFKILYKQILSDKDSFSFKYESIENDLQLLNLIKDYYKEFNNKVIDREENNLLKILNNIEEYDLDKIYLNNDATITNFSNKIYGNWNYIKEKLYENYEGKGKAGTKKYLEEREKYFENQNEYSIKFLENNLKDNKISEYIKDYVKENNLLENIKEKYKNIEEIVIEEENQKKLINSDKTIIKIKDFLDSIMQLQYFVKNLIPKDNSIEKDVNFYNSLIEIYDCLKDSIRVYNVSRNYLTQKPYSTEKIKLNFSNPDFLSGWAKEQEINRGGLLFQDKDLFYLGIVPKGQGKNFKKYPVPNSDNDVFYKLDYYQMADPSKDIQNLMVIDGKTVKKNGRKNENGENKLLEELKQKYLPAEINKIRKNGTYKKENFKKEDFIKFIDYYKQRIIEYYSLLEFNFKPSDEYEDYVDFTKDIKSQAYQIQKVKISKEYINDLVNDGKLYLFQIYNKDFSEYSKGTPNLHTLYWKALFDEKNLEKVVYKLNGEAEIFYRKASITKEKPTHPANVEINNKTIINGKETSIFEYDLIKDKRYCERKYLFHVPITLNFSSSEEKNINSRINKYLKYNGDNVYVIGIDRGERNLLYYSLINSKGEIIEQNSLNKLKNDYVEVDYHEKLTQKANNMMEERKNWKSIENIKELKEGYMSQVVNKIMELIKKYNAIIVIEDLNMGFKNSRKKVEKQVYQKFEKMLIEKLNYLVYKKNDIESEGGLLNAYQLTNRFESFNKINKQTGILYYVPAGYTSKIDPTTGFVNFIFLPNQSLEKSNEFVKSIDDIKFNKKENYFEFYIDYNKLKMENNTYVKFGQNTNSKWTLCSYGYRIKNFKNPEIRNKYDSIKINLTENFLELFKQYNINLSNIKEDILKKADSKFYNATIQKEGFEGFTNLFKLMIQMRNSVSGDEEDNIISPVKNKNNEFFDTNNLYEKLPKDADANGAYNIARKGLMLINQIKDTKDEDLGKVKYKISNNDWIKYVQDGKNL